VLDRAGQARAYRYRFRDPRLVPSIFMDAVAAGLLFDEQLADMLEVDKVPRAQVMRFP